MSAQPAWHWGSFLAAVPTPNGLHTIAVVAVDRQGTPCAARPLRAVALPAAPPWVPPPLPPLPPVPHMVAPSPLQPPTPAEIRRWREVRGLSQGDLAYRVGHDRSSVAEMERGVRPAVELRRAVGRLMARTLALPAGELPPPVAPVPALEPAASVWGPLPAPPSAEACREWRVAQGWSQREMARRAGGHSGYVRLMESGERPHLELRHRIGALMAAAKETA